MTLTIDRAGGDTLSERAAARIEADIVSGALVPGAKLGIAELATQYGIGATRVSSSFGHTSTNGSDYTSAVCGILALQVENSIGWATGADPGAFGFLYGIHGSSVSYSAGKVTASSAKAINAFTAAIGCRSDGGLISSPQKHLGTP